VPLYEYECARHGRFEVMKKYSDPRVESCPTCGGSVEKLFSAPAIQFKGSGWYVTDYARKSGGESKSGEGKSGEKSGDKSGDKSSEKSASRSSESKDSGSSKSESTSSSGSSSSGSSSSSSSTDSK
jgi:putative FmdB family regulatory protein